MAERGSGLGMAAEPYWVPPNHPCWAVDRHGSVAITWRMTGEPVPCSRLEAGDGFVAVKWGHVNVIGVYIPPRFDVAQFEEHLEDIRECHARIPPGPVVVAGDFNAKSALWCSPVTNARGRILADWAASLGLVLTTSLCRRRWMNTRPGLGRLCHTRVTLGCHDPDLATVRFGHVVEDEIRRKTPPEVTTADGPEVTATPKMAIGQP
ncbi:uncharacterized protein [Temnothorax nylanderi]|uniref:uncharacterized protein n=1 Tax=Temnothorax nylanderi TaxID=102681 RepID=UPI003A83F46D